MGTHCPHQDMLACTSGAVDGIDHNESSAVIHADALDDEVRRVPQCGNEPRKEDPSPFVDIQSDPGLMTKVSAKKLSDGLDLRRRLRDLRWYKLKAFGSVEVEHFEVGVALDQLLCELGSINMRYNRVDVITMQRMS